MQKHLIFIFILFFTFVISQSSYSQQEGQSYEQLMKSGNEKFSAKDFISAKTYFEMALRLKTNDAAAQKKLDETVVKIREQMNLQETFYQYLDYGDRLHAEEKLELALAEYQKALAIFPDDQYTNAQVKNINDVLNSRREKLASYESAMKVGEDLLLVEKFQEALLKFEEAAEIFPNEKTPNEKIAEATRLFEVYQTKLKESNQLRADAEQLILRKDFAGAETKLVEAFNIFPKDSEIAAELEMVRQQKQKSENYNIALEEADRLYEEKKFEEARSAYQQALNVWAEQQYPQDMIQRIDKMFQSDEYIAQKNYEAAIASAQQFEKSLELESAINQYNKALEYKPNDELATNKVNELREILANAAAREELEKQYANLLANADKAEKANQLQEALNAYMDASELKPEESFPKEKIATLKAQLQEYANQQAIQEQYDALIAEADQLFTKQELENSKAKYVEAHAVINNDYPKTQIAKIDNLLAEKALALEIDARYFAVLTAANELLDQKQYLEAKVKFNEALAIKDEDEPKQKISEIDGILAKMAQELDMEFNRLVSLGDEKVASESFEEALNQYNQALAIKADNEVVKQKIADATAKWEARNQLAALENNYQQLVKSADTKLSDKNYIEAKNLYAQALSLFADREYPQQKITEIDKVLAEQAAVLALETNYSNLIQQADNEYNTLQFQKAIESYQSALELKKNETYPAEQILKAQLELENIAKNEALNAQYNEKIAVADELFTQEKWNEAIASYQEALKLKASETYPQSKIDEINTKLNELAAFEAKQNQLKALETKATEAFEANRLDESKDFCNQMLAIDAANEYATARIAEIQAILAAQEQEREENYQAAIALGDQSLNDKKYKESINHYKTAIGVKPGDEYATGKIAEAENILREKMLLVKAEYTKFISEADASYNSNSYDKAIDSYIKAEQLETGETYPREMIDKITKYIEDNKLVELNSAQIQVAMNSSKRFEFTPINITERRSNYVLIKAKNLGDNSFPLIVSFGSKEGRNGGFVLPIPEDQEYHDFIVKIGSQYKWFSEDNTWIEISPENGQIEIGLIQVSKGN